MNIEQEITGDVLLELDANLLKTEIGIMAFGKRVRISNAISELRRPPSVSYSDHHHITQSGVAGPGVGVGEMMHTPITPQSQVHSRTQSQSHSHHSFSGVGGGGGGGGGGNGHGHGHQYSQSIQSSLGSPLGFNGTGNGNGMIGFMNASGSGGSGGFVGVTLPLAESPQDYVHVSRPVGDGGDGTTGGGGIGLGISDGSAAHLVTSSSFTIPSFDD